LGSAAGFFGIWGSPEEFEKRQNPPRKRKGARKRILPECLELSSIMRNLALSVSPSDQNFIFSR
jgi:hypothetical protein